MKIYLASRYSNNGAMRDVRSILHANDHRVTSRWIDCHPDVVGDFSESFNAEFLNSYPDKCAPLGQHDIDDLVAADCMISFTGSGGKGGRHIEFGYGLALGKRMIIVGPRENIFHTLKTVEHFLTWSEFVAGSGLIMALWDQ